MKTLTIGILVLVLVGGGILLLRSGRSARPRPGRPNILLVTIDTLRADRLQRGLTPTLDALAESGLRFSHARTVVPLTLPSHATILTGLLPTEHGVRQNGQRLAPTVPTLAQRLRDAGYRTGAFVGAYVLDRRFGLANGFDRYDDRVHRDAESSAHLEAQRRGSEVVDAANAWLADVPSPFFLWVHLYDPHAPYDPPAEFLSRAAGNGYDGEVAYADAQVGRLLDGLQSRGLLSTTVIVVTGDHGEGLGEHGELTHGMLAYDSTLRVPLVVNGPGAAARLVTAPVSLVDLAPSLLLRAGIQDAAAQTNHQDLFGPIAADRDAYAETTYPRVAGWHPLSVLAGAQWKLVMSSAPELYDLSLDPAELNDLASKRPGVVEGMEARLRQLGSVTPTPAPAVSPQASERLRALGYVASSASAAAADPRAPNPSSVIAAWSEFERDLALVNAGRPRQALGSLQTLAERFPGAPVFQSTYGRALKDTGRAADAVLVYRQAVYRWPDDGALFHDLAVAATAAGDVGEALRAELTALALDPNDPATLNGMGLLLVEEGKAAEAAAAFERAANGDPSNVSYWTNLGTARRESGDLAAAESAYKRALESDPSYPGAANGLGVLLMQQHRANEAIPWFERALERVPALYEARVNLGIAYQETDQREKAAATYREILATAPPGAERERQAAEVLLKEMKQE